MAVGCGAQGEPGTHAPQRCTAPPTPPENKRPPEGGLPGRPPFRLGILIFSPGPSANGRSLRKRTRRRTPLVRGLCARGVPPPSQTRAHTHAHAGRARGEAAQPGWPRYTERSLRSGGTAQRRGSLPRAGTAPATQQAPRRCPTAPVPPPVGAAAVHRRGRHTQSRPRGRAAPGDAPGPAYGGGRPRPHGRGTAQRSLHTAGCTRAPIRGRPLTPRPRRAENGRGRGRGPANAASGAEPRAPTLPYALRPEGPRANRVSRGDPRRKDAAQPRVLPQQHVRLPG